MATESPDIHRSVAVRPKVLLWALLCACAFGTIFFAFGALFEGRKFRALEAQEPRVRQALLAKEKSIQEETNSAVLRSLALKYTELRHAESVDFKFRVHALSGAYAYMALGQGVMSAVLAYSLYGLRRGIKAE